jgi:hypothetical protein
MARWTCRFTIQTQNLAGIYGEEERAIDPNQAMAPENFPGARRLPVGEPGVHSQPARSPSANQGLLRRAPGVSSHPWLSGDRFRSIRNHARIVKDM